jgi:hypothetical protein
MHPAPQKARAAAARGMLVIRQTAAKTMRTGKKIMSLKHLTMAKTNVRRGDRGEGADLINTQRAIDDAINERLKSNTDSKKLDPRLANNQNKTEHTPDLSQKKTGRSKH